MPHLFLNNEEVRSYKYLGVTVSTDLKWDIYAITSICQRSKKLLGIMCNHCVDAVFLSRLYLSLVRPIFEYASPVWDPYTQKNIHQLESVQKLALKICSHCWDIDYHILLDTFTLPTLASRREYLRILKSSLAVSTFHLTYYFQLLTPSKLVPTKIKTCILFPFLIHFLLSLRLCQGLCVCGII